MRLGDSDKDKLRKHIVEQLEKVPDGQRVRLDKDLLEDLLFKVIMVDKEKGIELKLPIWSGYFLKKIDLSQVDFSNVSWGIIRGHFESVGDFEVYCERNYPALLDEVNGELYEQIIEDRLLRGDYIYDINYSGTNANIDLTKSYEAKYKNCIILNSCNFQGIDFSQQDLAGVGGLRLFHTDVSETKLVVPSDLQFFAYGSKLEGLDLSTREMDAISCIASYINHDNISWPYDDDKNNFFIDCDLKNTGIRINVNPDYLVQSELEDPTVKQVHDRLQYAVTHKWIGCYVNGKMVRSVEEREKLKETKSDEYEQMKAEIFNSVTDSIDEQVSHMRK